MVTFPGHCALLTVVMGGLRKLSYPQGLGVVIGHCLASQNGLILLISLMPLTGDSGEPLTPCALPSFSVNSVGNI